MSGIKLIGSGAAPISPLLLEAMYKKIGGIVCEAYGLTECAGGCTANPPSRKGSKLGSVGLPLPDTKIKIVDIEGGDWELTPGEVGEICVKGPQVMKGYWERPQETEQVLREGWIYTGDIGYLDKDGYLHIVDRKKDMVIYKGYNVYPRELEEVLGKHSAVQQVAVVGEPDERAGEIPVAFVVLRQGSNVTEQQLLEYANSKLAGYKKIRKLFVVETLPISPAGKILKRILRAQLKQLSRG
jgi:long-chain acyl-CoA synthetase